MPTADELARARSALLAQGFGAPPPASLIPGLAPPSAPMAPQAHMPPPPMPGFDPRAMAAPMAPAAPRPMITQEQIEAEEARLAREKSLHAPGAATAATPAAARLILQAQKDEAGKPKIYGPPPEANENERRVYTTKPIEMTGKAPAARGGGGGGGGTNPIAALTAARKGDEKTILGTYDAEKQSIDDATRGAAIQTSERADAMERLAREQETRAAEEAAYQRDYEGVRAQYMDESNKLTQEIRESKVDPNRLFSSKSDAGSFATAIALAIGGAAGGMLQAVKGGENTFVAQLNRTIDRDIAAQETAIRNKKDALGAKQNLFAQLRQSHNDSATARLQTKNAMLESAKTTIEAQSIRLGTPEHLANGQRAMTLIERQQADLKRQIDAAAEAGAIKQAQAAAGARAAEEERRFKRGVELQKLANEGRKLDIEEAKETGGKLGEKFVATDHIVDAQGNKIPTGYVARSAEVAQKRTDGLTAAKKVSQLYQDAIDEREQQGKLGRLTSRNEGSIVGTPEWKTRNTARRNAILLAKKEIDHLGALSGSDRELEDPGDMNAMDLIGDSTTDRLRAQKKIVDDAIKTETEQEGGARYAKQIGPNGREVLVPLGALNAPVNDRAVQRLNPDGSPRR